MRIVVVELLRKGNCGYKINGRCLHFLKSTIAKIVNQWNEENEGLKVVRKLKELTK